MAHAYFASGSGRNWNLSTLPSDARSGKKMGAET
jgi:hypothetical protein